MESNERNSGHPRPGMDFTGWNVQRLSKEAQKGLEPLLQQALPRRRRGAEYSSYYRALRVHLLPHNPHFLRDIADLRKLFQIPDGQIAKLDLTQFPDRKAPWDEFDETRSEEAAGYWLEIHRHHFLKLPLGDWIPPLPRWLIDSAHTVPVFGDHAQIGWLQKESTVPERYATCFDLRVPIDRCVTRLIERYQLPWLCGPNLQRFMLTQDSTLLHSIFPVDIEIEGVTTSIGEAFAITVVGIDEFTTRKQWNDIFDKYVRPRQEYYLERRGSLRHSKQLQLKELLEPWVIETYHIMVKEGFGVDLALEHLSRNEKLPPYAEGIDRSVLYKQIKKLNLLCRPRD